VYEAKGNAIIPNGLNRSMLHERLLRLVVVQNIASKKHKGVVMLYLGAILSG
jgi:hypothetical protein